MMPKVSVIIPTYNSGHFLVEAINSVLDQTYKDIEVVVVDDGSTDNTREVLKSFGDRIKCIFQENQGAYAARNRGLKEAGGEFIGVIDHDDMWLPEKLEKQMKLFEKDPELGFVCSATHTINENGEITGCWRRPKHCQDTFDCLFETNFAFNLTGVIRRQCMDAVGGWDSSLKFAGDYDLWLRLAKRFRFQYLDEPLALYRIHEKSITQESGNWIQLGKELTTSLGKPEVSGDKTILETRVRQAETFYRFAEQYKQERIFLGAAKCYLKSLIAYPLIGAHYWPKETEWMRFSMPYRILKVYFFVFWYHIKGMFQAKV